MDAFLHLAIDRRLKGLADFNGVVIEGIIAKELLVDVVAFAEHSTRMRFFVGRKLFGVLMWAEKANIAKLF